MIHATIYSKPFVMVSNTQFISYAVINAIHFHNCLIISFCTVLGITLRKVEKNEQKEKERSTAFHDVASILARRVAIELSESEDSDSDEDSECWVEPTETSA